MNKNPSSSWKEKKSFFGKVEDIEFHKEENPNLPGKKIDVRRARVKDLPFIYRYTRHLQFVAAGLGLLTVLSKPIYDTYLYYTDQKPLKRADIQLHPRPVK